MSERAYYEVADIAVVVGKSTPATRAWLRRMGVAKKLGGRWIVTSGKLLANLPEVFQKLIAQSA